MHVLSCRQQSVHPTVIEQKCLHNVALFPQLFLYDTPHNEVSCAIHLCWVFGIKPLRAAWLLLFQNETLSMILNRWLYFPLSARCAPERRAAENNEQSKVVTAPINQILVENSSLCCDRNQMISRLTDTSCRCKFLAYGAYMPCNSQITKTVASSKLS